MIQLSGTSDLEHLELDAELPSGRLDRCQLPRPGRWIPQHGDAASFRNRFLDQLQPFAGQTGLIEKAPRYVPTGLREAADEPGLNGVALQVDRHDRGRARRIFRGQESGRADRKQQVNLSLDEVRGETREGFWLPIRKSELERHVRAIDVAEVSQVLSCVIDSARARANNGDQYPHHWHLPRLLCGGRERTRDGASCKAGN